MVFGGIWGQLFPKLFPTCIDGEDERTDCAEGAAPRIERTSEAWETSVLPLNYARTLFLSPVCQIPRSPCLVFGINKLRSDEMPYFGAKDPRLGAFVQLLYNQKSNGFLRIGAGRKCAVSPRNQL